MYVKEKIKKYLTGQNNMEINPYMRKSLYGIAASSSIVGGFYSLGYDVDYFLLAVGLAFVSYLIYYSRKNKNRSN